MSTKTSKKPQPPPTASSTASSSTLSIARSRSATTASTVIPPLIVPPSESRTKPKARSNFKPTHNNNSHNNSPRQVKLIDSKEPETDHGERKRSSQSELDELNEESDEPQWLRTSSANIRSMEKQAIQILNDTVSNNAKQQTRYTYICDTIAGKEEQLTTLQGSYEILHRELRELESLCDDNIDPSRIDELYMSLSLDQRVEEN